MARNRSSDRVSAVFFVSHGGRHDNRDGSRSLGPAEIIAIISCAFRAVFAELELSNRDDVIALRAVRLIIALAAQGERDPERLKVATLT
jgi:hypothetical protein